MLGKRIQFTVELADVLEYKRKRQAQHTTRVAVRNGVITKKERCELCDRFTPTLAHHVDYGRPLEIVWVCKLCHIAVHKKDHSLNPLNNPQTPTEIWLEDTDFMRVDLRVDLKTYLALSIESKEKEIPISTILTKLIATNIEVKTYDKSSKKGKNDKSQHAKHVGVSSLGKNETSLLEPEEQPLPESWREGGDNLPRMGGRLRNFFQGNGANASRLQRTKQA